MKKLLTVVAALAMLTGIAPKHAQALSDGTPSTGSFTIATNASLAQASATGTTAIVTVTGLTGTRLNIGAYQFVAGRDFLVGASTAATATSLKNAINASGAPVSAAYTAADTSVALTAASPGALYNGVGTSSNDTSKISVGAATLTGGLDNAYVSINGIRLTQGSDWYKQDVASNTAINLAGVINNNPTLGSQVNAQWIGGSSAVVYLRSKIKNTAYSLSTSGSVITKSGIAMTGGAAGNLYGNPCWLGAVNTALPTGNYPAGCMAYLNGSGPYISTEAVAGAQSWARLYVTASAIDTGKIACLTAAGKTGYCNSALQATSPPRCDTCTPLP